MHEQWLITMKSLQLGSLTLKFYCCFPCCHLWHNCLCCSGNCKSYQPGKGMFTLTHHAGLHQQSRVVWHHQICSLLFCCGIQWGEVALHLDNGWRLAWIQPDTADHQMPGSLDPSPPRFSENARNHLMSLDVTWCHLMSLDVTWCHLYHFI